RRRLLLLGPANGSWSLRAEQELDFAPQSVRAWIQVGELHVALGGAEGVLSVQRRAIGAEASAPWTPLARIETPGSVRALCAHDLDGDGRMDLAALCVEAGTDKPGVVQVVQQRESGFASVGPRLWTGARPYAIQAADLNGDGRAELTVSAQNSHQMNLWIGRAGAEPGFSAAPDLGVGTGPLDCMFCDLDGDGVAELITTNAFSDDLSVVSFR
ncbi:MAG: FG-GAP repeat domain-containing protein, partial [Planctomycetia bacterium]